LLESLELGTMYGTRKFYQQVGDILGRGEAMRQVLDGEYEQVKDRYEALKARFGSHRFALCAWMGNAASVVKNYQNDYGIFPAYLFVELTMSWLRERGVSAETVAKMQQNVRDRLAAAGFSGKLIDIDSAQAVKECLPDVEAVIGGNSLRSLFEDPGEFYKIKIVSNLGTYAPLNMQSRLDLMEQQLSQMEMQLSLTANAPVGPENTNPDNINARIKRWEADNPHATKNAETSFEGHRHMWWDSLEQEFK
jgi:hypothetical protein